MGVSEIVLILEALAKAAEIGYKVYNDTNEVLSEEDAQKIHAALLKAQAATNELRPLVDAALEEAKSKE